MSIPVTHWVVAPFDIIIVGGGTFGSVFAQHLFYGDTTHSHRILVIEAGPFTLPEHVQNTPMIGEPPCWGVSHIPFHAAAPLFHDVQWK
jgi:choline dehydrogenase-like flavoprotein